MRRSGRICDLAMGEITSSVAADVTEFEISSRVDYLMHNHGGKYPSFDTGVFAMGPALDREASTRLTAEPPVEGLGVSYDFGTAVDGYCSDFGRTVLEEGMTFTIEPSIFWPGTVGVRVEDMFVCRPGGAECLNTYSRDLVAV